MSEKSVELYYAWVAADKAWSAELKRAFGKAAGDKRYVAAGHGKSGTALRAAYDAWRAAQTAYTDYKENPE